MADSPRMVEEADAVVVGTRCAGSAAAATLARAGRRVIALDSARFPSDTLSTHLLWPSGVAELSRLGALDAVTALGAPELTHAFAAGAGYTIATPFPQVDGIDYTLCVRRTGLDHALVRTAVAAGAEVRQRHRVTELVWDGDRCTGVRYTGPDDRGGEIRAPLVIGADGRRSTVARLAGVQTPYEIAPSGRDCFFAYWRDNSAEWRATAAQWREGSDLGTAFPCDDGLLLCLVQPPADTSALRPGDAERRYAAALDRIPPLRARLHGCEQVGRVRAVTGLASYFRRSSGRGWALPGDSGHFKDPVTAQGIRDALHYGRRLAEVAVPVLHDPAALDRALAGWEQQRVRECREIFHWTNRLARGTALSPLEVELYRTATHDPELAALTIEIFSRTRRPAELYTPPRMARLTAGALWHHRRDPKPVLADLGYEIATTAREFHTSCTTLRGAPPAVPSSTA
ncbi:NAD(P)/FAD-dependent oxidoreductase [Nocardia sp. X0981]